MSTPTRGSTACDDFRSTSSQKRDSFIGDSKLTRRRLLGYGALGGMSLYAAQAMPMQRVLEAAEADAQANPNAPILVSVFLPGGLDLLDSLIPVSQYGRYAELHPNIRVEDPELIAGGGLGLHPSMAQGVAGGVAGLYKAGKIGFFAGIDYPDPNLSHFHSRHFWETGIISGDDSPGWLGRWLDRNGNQTNPLQGLSMSYDLSPVLRSRSAPIASASSPGAAAFYMRNVYGEAFDDAMRAYGALAGGRARNASYKAAKRNAALAKQVGDQLLPYAERDGKDPLAGSVAYPDNNNLAERLRTVAGLLAQPLGIRVVTVYADGDYDTHDNQKSELAQTLAKLSQALGSFQTDLEARGLADRVMTFVWSEFGRRPVNNGSGTDHGAGGVAWVMGSRARSGLLSEYPDLRNFDDHDNLKVTLDFRTVYASLIEQWMGTDAGAVLPSAGGVGRVQLVK